VSSKILRMSGLVFTRATIPRVRKRRRFCRGAVRYSRSSDLFSYNAYGHRAVRYKTVAKHTWRVLPRQTTDSTRVTRWNAREQLLYRRRVHEKRRTVTYDFRHGREKGDLSAFIYSADVFAAGPFDARVIYKITKEKKTPVEFQ